MTGTSSVDALRLEERLDDLDDLRGIGHVKKDHTGSLALQGREVGGLWFECAQDRFHRSPERAIVNRCITFFDRKGEFQHHAHGRLPVLENLSNPGNGTDFLHFPRLRRPERQRSIARRSAEREPTGHSLLGS